MGRSYQLPVTSYPQLNMVKRRVVLFEVYQEGGVTSRSKNLGRTKSKVDLISIVAHQLDRTSGHKSPLGKEIFGLSQGHLLLSMYIFNSILELLPRLIQSHVEGEIRAQSTNCKRAKTYME